MNRAIVLISDRKNIHALGAFLVNLSKGIIDYKNIIVYIDGFKDDEADRLKIIDNRIKVIKYTYNNFIDEFSLDPEKINNLPYISNFSFLTSIKFKIFKELNDYEQVVFFDTDMLLLDNIDEVLNTSFNIGWRDDRQTIDFKLKRAGVDVKKIYNNDYCKDFDKITTPNGGFIVINNNFDYNNAYKIGESFLKKSLEFFPSKFSIIENLFGYVAYTMKLNINIINQEIYNVFLDNVKSYSRLIHFVGKQYKPWSSEAVQLVFSDWMKNYKEFVEKTDISSNDVKYFSKINNFILDNYFNRLIEKIQKDIFIPEYLHLSLPSEKNCINMRYNDQCEYKIKIHGYLFTQAEIKCIIKKDISTLVEIEIYLNLLKYLIRDKIELTENEDSYNIILKDRKIGNIKNNFSFILDKTEKIRAILAHEPVDDYKILFPLKARLLSFHNTFLYIKDDILIHRKSGQEDDVYIYRRVTSYLLNNKICFFIDSENKFISKIAMDGKVELVEDIYFFNYIYSDDGSIYILNENDKCLSARIENNIVIWCDNKLSWEKFYITIIK